MLLNCDVGEDSWESLGWQGDPTSPSWRKSVLNILWKDWCWRWNSDTLSTWCEELTHLKRPWCWERLRVGWERDDRGWDGWMASLTQWTWVWTSSRSWWWTEKPGVLQSIESQRVGHDWATELNWKECLQWVALRLNTSSPFKPSTFSTHFFIWRSCHPHTSAAPLYPSPALYLIFHTVPVSSLPSVPLAITLVHNSVTSSHIS